MFRDALGGKHPEMWEKVIQMGHELSPENGMFGSAYTSDNHHAAEEFEFNEQDLPELSLQDQVFSPEESQDHEASDLDFDLSAIESEETDVGTNESVGNTNDNSLDFDLGAFDFKQTKSEEAQVAESDSGLDFDLSALDDLDATKDSSTMKAEDDNRSLDFDISSKAEVEDAQNDQNVVDFDFDTSASAQSSDISDHETSFDTVAERESKDESFDFDLSSFENQPANQEDNVYAMNMGKPSSTELEIKEVEIDSELDDSLFADVDEVGTKLDLARAYIDMGDSEGARSILDEVIEEGNDNQKHEAEGLIRQMG